MLFKTLIIMSCDNLALAPQSASIKFCFLIMQFYNLGDKDVMRKRW